MLREWTQTKEWVPNEVSYISTYYIQPKVVLGEDVRINYYVTDFFHKEYLHDDFSEKYEWFDL